MIDIQNLVKYYGDICAVNDVSFTVRDGEILGFLGPNGAGKTTIMNILTGYISATAGQVTINGHDILEKPQLAKRCIGYLPENPPLYPEMTVLEFLRFVADLKCVPRTERNSQLLAIIKLTRISEVVDRLIRNLSKGFRQRVGIAQALIGNPEVLILDEPTVGLDPKQIIETRELIRGLGRKHTVILSSHILTEVQAVCERIVIINKGKIAAIDTPEGLLRRTTTTARISLTVEGPDREIVQRLRLIPGILHVTTVVEKEDERHVFEIENTLGQDVRKQIFYEMSRNSWPIIEMRSLDPTLEEMFLLVTAGQKSRSGQGGKA
jgi:ABC-2 type transport system ATP-binding protein